MMKILLLICLCLVTAGCTAFSGVNRDGKTISIAGNLPLTGALAVYGQCIRDGSTLAIEDLKKIDPSGPHFVVDWQDNAGEPKTAVSIMQKQLIDQLEIYVSGVHPQVMAIKDQIHAKGIPNWVWIFDAKVNSDSVTSDSPKNNFRTWVNFKIEPPVFINYVRAHKPQRIAILYPHVSHCEEEYQRTVIPALKEMGVANLLVEPYEFGLRDFKILGAKVQDFKPDLVIVDAFQDGYVSLIPTFRSLGLVRNGNILTSYDMIDAAASGLGKQDIEGIPFTAPLFITRPESKEIKLWTERFRKRFNRRPLYTDAYAYDAIMIMHDAAKRLRLPATNEQWIAALRSTKLTGVTGPLLFDDDGSLVTPVELGVFKNGVVVPYTH